VHIGIDGLGVAVHGVDPGYVPGRTRMKVQSVTVDGVVPGGPTPQEGEYSEGGQPGYDQQRRPSTTAGRISGHAPLQDYGGRTAPSPGDNFDDDGGYVKTAVGVYDDPKNRPPTAPNIQSEGVTTKKGLEGVGAGRQILVLKTPRRGDAKKKFGLKLPGVAMESLVLDFC